MNSVRVVYVCKERPRAPDVHTLIYQVRLFMLKWAEFTDFVEAKLNSCQ